jgi:phage terminase large subunit-like protein
MTTVAAPRKRGRPSKASREALAPKVSKRWLHTLALIPKYNCFRDAGDCRFDEAAADAACDFFSECLQHIEGAKAGQPFVLEPWQRAIVGCLFGWKQPDGTRRYRECLLLVPRKNGKTPLAAGILNLVLFCDNEPGAQIYGAAADIPQASLLFRHAAGMIAREPELSSRCTVYDSYRSVVLKADKGTVYKVISGEAKGKHGQNTHFAVIDEEHEQSDRDLVDTLATSFASANRRQPIFMHVTTAGWDRNSICYETYQTACRVRDGVSRDPTFLPVIFEAEEGDDWADEKVWAKANPNLGVSVSLDYLRRECQKAKENPSKENVFKRLHLNIWTEQAVRWLAMDRWDVCGQRPIELKSLEGRQCYLGLDLSATQDITAAVLDFPMEDGSHVWLPKFWVPCECAHVKERHDRVPYETWAREGLVELTDGAAIDYKAIRAWIQGVPSQYNLAGIAADGWNAKQLLQQLDEEDGFNVCEFRQGFASYNAPSKELERLLAESKLIHGGNPVLRWMASNVAAVRDVNDNVRPAKDKSTGRIDGIVAGIEALGMFLVTGQPVSDSWGFVL